MRIAIGPATAGLLLLAACGKGDAPPPPAGPPEVSVERVAARPIAVADELPGRVVASRVAEIRPQVSGIIRRRMFEQGSIVHAGQPLFQIDPGPFAAEVAGAAATVRRSAATLRRAEVQERRLSSLVSADAISGQSYDDAVAARDQAAADLAQAEADLQRRRVDLGFATIRAPIAGRIDQAVLTEGALAAVGATAALATVQQIDSVYIDVRQPAARLEALRVAARAGMGAESAPVEIVSAEGRPYGIRGRLLFSGISVDPTTGEVISRIEVANHGQQLLPGMFVRARLPRLALPAGIAVPRQAVTRDPDGRAVVSLVGAGGKVVTRTVETGDERDGRIVVTRGLAAGDAVIVEGQDRVHPGTVVKPMPWRASATGTTAG